jgi:hypothetical protein
MTSNESKAVTFETTVSASGNNTGIAVPPEIIEQLAAGSRSPVLVTVNGAGANLSYQLRRALRRRGGLQSSGILPLRAGSR